MSTATKQSGNTARFESIVFVRGLAALFVVLHHAGRIVAQPRFYGVEPFGGIFEKLTGTNYFFVLSGFFVGWIRWKLIGKAGEAWPFAVQRMSRIYPSYWLILFPLIALYWLFPSAGFASQRDTTNVVLSILLLPYTSQPVYGVAWTLVQEMLFCIIFSLVILGGKKAAYFLPLWAVLILVVRLLHPKLPYPLGYFLNGANLQFLIGIGVARMLATREIGRPYIVLIFGAAVYLGFMILEDHHKQHIADHLIYGIGAAMVIAGLVGVERKRAVKVHPWMMRFGIASYSLYLIHPVALSLSMNALSRLPIPHLPIELAVVLITVFAVATALLFDRYIEAPFMARAAPLFQDALLGPRVGRPARS